MLFDILDLSLGSTLLGPSRFESGCFRHEEVEFRFFHTKTAMRQPFLNTTQPSLYLAVGEGAKLKSDKTTRGG